MPHRMGLFMFKKINLVLIAMGVFLTCLAISFLIKKYFHIDGDYLSAFATLFAAGVALILYSDWRDQQRFVLIEKYQEFLRENGREVFSNYGNFYSFIRTLRNEIYTFENTESELTSNEFLNQYSIEFDEKLSLLTTTLFHASTLLHEYQILLKLYDNRIEDSEHYKEMEQNKMEVLSTLKKFNNSLDSTFLRIKFLNVADLTNDSEIEYAIKNYIETCGYSCVKFLNSILLGHKKGQ